MNRKWKKPENPFRLKKSLNKEKNLVILPKDMDYGKPYLKL